MTNSHDRTGGVDASGVSTQGPWRQLREPTEIADALIGLYAERGSGRYSEVVSQNEHALQCGSHAIASGTSDRTVLAAFLHDIGHLLRRVDEEGQPPEVDHRHEQVGARFLANWFGSAVTRPVQMHVSAKRYLCATDQSYFDGLSPASVHSLELQGGPMTPDEAIAYRANPYHAEAVELRRWDDLAKVSGAPTPGFDVFHGLIIDVLEAR